MVWRKTILNAAMSPLCAHGLTIARPIVILSSTHHRHVAEGGIQVARPNEIQLGWDFYTYAMYLGNAGDTSLMLIDTEKSAGTEIDYVKARIVEYGERVGIPTRERTIRSLVKALSWPDAALRDRPPFARGREEK